MPNDLATLARLLRVVRSGPLTADVLADVIDDAIEASKPTPTPDHWSDWLDWAGGPCPLPPNALVTVTLRDSSASGEVECAGNCEWRHYQSAADIIRFRYRCDPSGWLPRGDWIPPGVLWDEACPVRCEWTRGLPTDSPGTWKPDIWDHKHQPVTHIRLRPREKAGEMPEFSPVESAIWSVIKGWDISREGVSYAAANGDDVRKIADAVRKCFGCAPGASMKERGNG